MFLKLNLNSYINFRNYINLGQIPRPIKKTKTKMHLVCVCLVNSVCPFSLPSIHATPQSIFFFFLFLPNLSILRFQNQPPQPPRRDSLLDFPITLLSVGPTPTHITPRYYYPLFRSSFQFYPSNQLTIGNESWVSVLNAFHQM
jgi:hypothetical protein